jgi:AraC-like DNA-binding protein
MEACAPTRISATAVHFPARSVESWHCHSEGQLLFPAFGSMRIEVPGQSWLISPQYALWIPPQLPHEGVFCTDVDLCALYIAEGTAKARAVGAPAPRAASGPRLSVVTPLLREVIIALARTSGYGGPAKDERVRLLTALLVHELDGRLDALEEMALPVSEPLRRLCAQIVARPMQGWTIDACASQVAMSRRTFTRVFRATTRMSFGAWLRAARLRQAAAKLRSGGSVASIAHEVGYGSPAAFSMSFRNQFGVAPSMFCPDPESPD